MYVLWARVAYLAMWLRTGKLGGKGSGRFYVGFLKESFLNVQFVWLILPKRIILKVIYKYWGLNMGQYKIDLFKESISQCLKKIDFMNFRLLFSLDDKRI